MGWFAIACICGYLGYWAWRTLSNWLAGKNQIANTEILSLAIDLSGYSERLLSLSNWLDRKHTIAKHNAGTIAATIAFAILFAGLVVWAIWSQDARTVGQIADSLHHGLVARFILGLVLGAGAAFVIAERSPLKPGGGDAAPTPGGLPMHLILSMGIGILLLALTAPYVDGWFRRLAGFKSPLIELQLVAGASTHKVSVTEGLDSLINQHHLAYMMHYDIRIRQDINYFSKYGQNGQNQNGTIKSAVELLSTFERILVPVMTCVQTAIDQGWLSIDSARQMITPSAELLEQIIFGEAKLGEKLEEKHEQFWQYLTKLPEIIHSRVGISDCYAVPLVSHDMETPKDLKALSRKFQDYNNVPYLHVAAALLISFTGDSDNALRVLQKAKDLQRADGRPALDFKDFTFLYLMARLSYYQSRPGDMSNLYLGSLNEMRDLARSRIKILEQAKEQCEMDSSPRGINLSPLCFAQIYEVVATNLTAWFLSEDLARGNEYAKNYTAQLQEDAEEIKRLLDELHKHGPNKNSFYSYLQNDEDGLLDTYAYAKLVLESRKPNPDYDLIKKEVIGVLRKVIGHREEKIKNSPQIDRYELGQLKVSQAHLASAQDLAGE